MPNLGISNRSQSASNQVSAHHTRTLKTGDRRDSRGKFGPYVAQNPENCAAEIPQGLAIQNSQNRDSAIQVKLDELIRVIAVSVKYNGGNGASDPARCSRKIGPALPHSCEGRRYVAGSATCHGRSPALKPIGRAPVGKVGSFCPVAASVILRRHGHYRHRSAFGRGDPLASYSALIVIYTARQPACAPLA